MIGGCGGINGSAEVAAGVNNPNGSIRVTVRSGALVGNVDGADNSTTRCKDIYITVEKGARVLESITGGGNTTNNYGGPALGYAVGPEQGYAPGRKQYETHADIHVKMDGEGRLDDGKTYRASVIGGGVYAGGHNADMELGDVYSWFGGTVTSGCDDGKVIGNTNVHIYGTILKKNYESANRFLSGAGSVFGGGYLGESAYISETDVAGLASVYVYDGSDVQGDVYGGGHTAKCSGGTHVVVSGTVRGDVYGGSWLHESTNQYGQYELGNVGDTYVELNGNASANNVYGGGRISNVHGGSTVILKDNAKAANVYGTGSAYTSFYHRGSEYSFGPISTITDKDAAIRVQDRALVTDAIYGYGIEQISGVTIKLLAGKAEVYFEHSDNGGVFKRVVNADLVEVTDKSRVTLDNAYQDNKQLVNVSDQTIDDSAVLEIRADAHILANYRGDKQQSGMLKIPAGKCLTADGTVTDLTKISIPDNTRDHIVPEEAQVYVISGAGSMTASGDFTWVDTRNGVWMEWRGNEDGTSQWWLVRAKRGDLTVSKTVSGSGAEQGKAFGFTVILSDRGVNGTFGDMQFENGTAVFTLKHGEQKTAKALQAGISYQVTENDNAGYTVTVNGENKAAANGVIPEEAAAEVRFNNDRAAVVVPTGDLTVNDMVSGNSADLNKNFVYTVILSDRSVNGTFGDMQFVNGVATFTLKHGEQKTARGLPAELTYQVTESEYDDYVVTVDGESKVVASGTIPAGRGVTVAYHNVCVKAPVPPQTGDNSHLTAAFVLLGLAAVTLTGITVYRKKKYQ